MGPLRHTRQRRLGLTLRPGRDNGYPFIRQLQRIAQIDQHPLGRLQVTQLLRNFSRLDHRIARQGNHAIVALCRVDHLLDAT